MYFVSEPLSIRIYYIVSSPLTKAQVAVGCVDAVARKKQTMVTKKKQRGNKLDVLDVLDVQRVGGEFCQSVDDFCSFCDDLFSRLHNFDCDGARFEFVWANENDKRD